MKPLGKEHVPWSAVEGAVRVPPETVQAAERCIRRYVPQDADLIIAMVCTGVAEGPVIDDLSLQRPDR